MRALVARLALLIAPFALLYALALHVLLESGELIPVDDVIELQRTSPQPVLFGVGYSEQTPYYKLRAVLARRPEVLALGSSRVMTIRSALFRNDVSFYNAGSGLPHIRVLDDFLRRVPAGQEPRVIVVGVDHWLFSAAWPRSIATMPNLSRDGPDGFKLLGSAPQKLVRDYVSGKYTLGQIVRAQDGMLLIGMNAVVHRHGFRKDGSHTIGVYDPVAHKQSHEEMLRGLAVGLPIFAPAQTVSTPAIEDLRRFLAQCRSRGIYVVGFLPPFTHAAYAVLGTDPRHAYLSDLAPSLSPVFRALGFEFFDFSDLAVLEGPDAEAFDPIHISEKAYVRLFIAMARRDERLRRVVVDIADLSARLAASRNPVRVFGD